MKTPPGRGEGVSVLALVLVTVLVLGCGGGCRSESRRPDVILLTVDTLRVDDIGVYGSPAHTPHIDGLIRRGTRFTHAFAPMPRTTPAVGSLMTGLWPKHHGSREVGEPLSAGTRLAEILRRRGYRTVGVAANGSAGRLAGLDRGFEHFIDGPEIRSKYEGRFYPDGKVPPPGAIGLAEATTREAMDLVGRVRRGDPLFLWVLYMDPHTAYNPPNRWLESVEAPACWALYEKYIVTSPELVWQVFIDMDGMASNAVADCRKLYRAEIAYVDHEIGRLFDGLRNAGRLKDAIVVFTADHGENFGEGGSFFEHGENAHDAGLRVPLAVAGPGIGADRIDGGAVSLVDVVPTLLSLVAPEDGSRAAVDGVDLTGRLRATGHPPASAPDRVVFAESASALRNQFQASILTGRSWQRACINGPRYTVCDVFHNERKTPELFDHVRDPGLTIDIAAEHPEIVRRLTQARRHWPPGGARQRVATTARFKLVQTPRLDGAYETALYDRNQGTGETRDVTEQHPQVAERLGNALEKWAANIPRPETKELDSATREILRNLGYLQSAAP